MISLEFETQKYKFFRPHKMNFNTDTGCMEHLKSSPKTIQANGLYSSNSSSSSNSLSSSPKTAMHHIHNHHYHQSMLSTSQPIDILNQPAGLIQRQSSSNYSEENYSANLSSNQNEDYSDSSMSEDFECKNKEEENQNDQQNQSSANNLTDSNEMHIRMEEADNENEANGSNTSNGANNTSSSSSNSSSGIGGSSGSGGNRVNRFFPDKVVDVLNKWFFENQEYPYPDDNMTSILAKQANISAKQVRKWFANKRVRSNKCFKQTVRSKKDRRQTKSIGDEEMFNLTEDIKYENDYNEDLAFQVNNSLNNYNLQKEKNRQQEIILSKQHHEQLAYYNNNNNTVKQTNSLSSSASSTSSSYYSSSPAYNPTHATLYSPTHHETTCEYNQMHRSTSAQTMQSAQDLLYSLWKNQVNKQQRQSSDASMSCNNTNYNNTNINNSCNNASTGSPVNTAAVTAAAVVATAAAVVNLQNQQPYFLINLLQNNPNIAFQAAITNRLLNLTNQQQQQQQQQQIQNVQTNTNTAKSTLIKRKTHLSNLFMNDLSQNEAEQPPAQFYNRNNSTGESSMATSNSNASTSSNRSSLSCSPSLSSPASSPCSVSSEQNQHHYHMQETISHNSQNILSYYQRLNAASAVNSHNSHYKYEPQSYSRNGTTAGNGTTRKINFGDISDLIN